MSKVNGKVVSTTKDVLTNLVKARINELTELLKTTDHPGQRTIIRTRIVESMEWLVSLGETVEATK